VNAGPVWIDLANSPHVLFFKPVIDELHRRGFATHCTAREFAQTVPLCHELGIDADVVGRHGGGGMLAKGRALQARVTALRAVARRVRPCVAVSHNSYSQVVAARSSAIPAVTAMDYEFQPANHLAFRCADLVVVPDSFPLDRLHAQGARAHATWRYPGLKEHITLAGFARDAGYLTTRGIDTAKVVVAVRPPATMALYHRFENPLFARLLRRLHLSDGLTVLLLPRTAAQALALAEQGFGSLLWGGEVLDGAQLVAGADVVISAGGSMNREAAVLGTPAYSIYAGKLAAVDRVLVAQGRLRLLSSEAQIDLADLSKKTAASVRTVGLDLVREFVDRVLAFAAL
jgi:uncharacterized protein